ncbi:triple tyrosine motif-containing protein [Mariniflexile ostreae]|uniref:Triple tyrosine motif-containing protein n=1 Tax=Mariniflexile ostreae TaxID=1520892 RepID=A0ABV5FBJ7_9FLAO
MKPFYFLFFILYALVFNTIKAQELPPIENFSPKHYRAANQNWMVSQCDNNYLYFANASGLLEYNGSTWNLYPTPNGSVVRSVNVIDDLIFTGFYMDFGYWKRDDFGTLHYTSLIDKLKVPLIKDEDFWKIVPYENRILFQSLDRIYIYNPIDESFIVIEAINKRAGIFILDKNIVFQNMDKGIFTIENGEAVLISDDPIVRNNTLVGAFLLHKQKILLTEDGKFYHLKETGITRWHIPADKDLVSENIYCSIQLNDKTIVLGTISNGIIHIDHSGQTIEKINKEKGLYNNTVLSIFEDHDHNLWLGLDNGISILNLKSHFQFYTDLKGKLGVVYTAKQFKENLYLGTNQGLFYKTTDVESGFKLVPNTEGQVWFLEELYGELFCGHNNGTYVIDNHQAHKISDFPGTWKIEKIKNMPHLLLQGNYKGLSILEKENDTWKFRNIVEGFDVSSRYFEFIDKNKLLLNNEYKGLFTLTFNDEFTKINHTINEPSHGYGSSLVTFNKHIYYTSNFEAKVLKYDFDNKAFFEDTLLTEKFYAKNNEIKGVLVSTPTTNTLWGFSDRNIISVSPGKFKNNLEVKNIPISSHFRRSLGIMGFENLACLKNGAFLIGASDGYAVLDINKFKTQKYDIKINVVQKKLKNTAYKTIALNGSSYFKSNENSFRFLFSVPEFSKYTHVEYQYQLEGFYNEWSLWSTEPSAYFSNLPFGTYSFKVRGRIGNTLTDQIETYNFTIDRPWYLSNLALFIYVGSLLLFTFLMHHAYKRHYKKQREKIVFDNQRELELKALENKQQLMRFNNDKLRQDVESKSRELGISTMSLIKKNEFLRSLKKEIIKVQNTKNIKPIIKIIDNNINNTDDWHTFEEAFNNADKDFLKKIKSIHPELTSNDLRLCAYLRLNLSSKEIAPLLNISSRSVEVKRYRLRKKMNLEHEASLSDYILGI